MRYKKLPLEIDKNLITLNIIDHLRFEYNNIFFEYNLNKSCDDMLKVFFPKLDFKILPDCVSMTRITTPGAPPHCDEWPVSLNFYLSTGNGTLFCYNLKNGQKPKGSTMYDLADLEIEEKVDVQKFDLILLNTHQIHSVEIPPFYGDRYIFRFIWSKHDFNEIANCIIVKN